MFTSVMKLYLGKHHAALPEWLRRAGQSSLDHDHDRLALPEGRPVSPLFVTRSGEVDAQPL
jgi:hypothetical protein